MVGIVGSEVPKTWLVVVATHKEQALRGRELRPIDVTVIGLVDEDNALFFISFEGNDGTACL